jgi:hypothetical protein
VKAAMSRGSARVAAAGLVGQRVRDLLQIDVAQVQHPARISLSR